MLLSNLLALDSQQVFGSIEAPLGVAEYNTGSDTIGILMFASNIIKLATVVAGVWVLFNFVTAGMDYVTSAGDSGAANKVKDKLTMSVVGLIIIVASHTIIAVLSFILFGNPGYILNPVIVGPA